MYGRKKVSTYLRVNNKVRNNEAVNTPLVDRIITTILARNGRDWKGWQRRAAVKITNTAGRREGKNEQQKEGRAAVRKGGRKEENQEAEAYGTVGVGREQALLDLKSKKARKEGQEERKKWARNCQ